MATLIEIEEVTPSWLNNAFLETALKSSEEDDLQVTSFEVSPATDPGDHFSSLMYRVKVHFTRGGDSETRSLVLKAELTTGLAGELSDEVQGFQRESAALSIIVPKLHSLIQEATPEKIPLFAPECLYSHWGPPAKVLVLEDLKVGGFKLAKREEGLDKDHCLLVFRTLARYHAASAVQYKKDPEFFKIFFKNAYREHFRNSILEAFFGNNIRHLAKVMENWPEFDGRFPKQLQKIAEVVATYLIESAKIQDDNFNVVNHGDLWVNNMMFQYSETTGEVQEVRFLDYPGGIISTAGFDLQYFLHTSPSMEVMNQHQMLLEEYYKTLGETFTLLGYEHLHPTLQQLEKQMDKMGMYAVVVACCVLPIVLSDRNDLPDIEKSMTNEEGMRFSQRYKNALKLLLPIFEKKGWLNAENFCTV